MKNQVVTLFALVAVVACKNIFAEDVTGLGDVSAHGYHTDVGIPLANKIRAAESQQLPTRIIGGLPAVLGQFPYQAGIIVDLISGEQSVCGGSILNTLRVLTAAHCWWNRSDQAWRFTVVGGSTTLFTGGLRRVTSQVVMHGNWDPTWNQNNIAMVYLATAFTLSNSLAVIALPSSSELLENFVGLIATASGYGVRRDGVVITPDQFLSYTNVHVVNNTECQQSTFPNMNMDSHICTSGKASGGSVCTGDIGGPLVVIRENRYILIGITSLISSRGCELGHPNAYTRVTFFADWIRNLL